MASGAPAIVRAQDAREPGVARHPEKGARLRVLRWKRFVEGDEEAFMGNVKRFSERFGVEVRVDHEPFEDLRAKAAAAANSASGPDVLYGWFDEPQQYPDKLVDVSDLCEDLGSRYGGWYDVARHYGTRAGGKWIAVPFGAAGACMVHRESALRAAGFTHFPTDTDGFLELCRALKGVGMPPGFALGNATGDANGWCHWLLWTFGGRLVDEHNRVAIDSPETLQALQYARSLYETFVPATLNWLDGDNNKAFLGGRIGLTSNGVSIYYSAVNSGDPKLKALASDISHASFPVGPVREPTELHLITQAMIFKSSKAPNAAKAFVAFMMEEPQYVPWQRAAAGYMTQPLKGFERSSLWTADARYTTFRDCMRRMVHNGRAGQLGVASAACLADFIVVNMVAEAASGSKTPREAVERARQRALRYYKDAAALPR